MRFWFHPAAEAEFGQAVEYYEQLQQGLGVDFAKEVHGTIALIVESPKTWLQISENIRRCLVNRFPYAVIYRIEPSGLHIIAVANLHRHPDYWQKRR